MIEVQKKYYYTVIYDYLLFLNQTVKLKKRRVYERQSIVY